ncbi:immunity repressor [Gordonia phage Maridalia]|uniref:Immunity repressor n=2 Tax=Nymphadoravirus TaxID=2169636 RepID=A0A7G8LLH1_9CAUD|nr:transcriptional repressor [Gordonia phage Bunnybear]YP_010653155.1 transcriptional repressor [Gordonia phage Maridalia]AZF98784.1 immunity repressor [Gordonia phage Maridalia]QNJ58093.1 immunity repressor [Gordonia phage Bunnybear]
MFAEVDCCLPNFLGIVGYMNLDRYHEARLGTLVRQRRAELGLTQKDVHQAGGPTDTTLTKIENGEWTPGNRKNTLRKLDAGLSWTTGSAARVLAGGEPTPLEDDDDGYVGTDDNGEELFSLPNARSYDYVTLRDGTEVPFPDELIEDAEIARTYLRDSAGDLDSSVRAILQGVVDRADLETLQARINRLTRSQLLELSAFVDELLTQQEGTTDDLTTEPSTQGRASKTPEGQKTRGRGSLPRPRPSREQIRSVGRRITTTRAIKRPTLTSPNQPVDVEPPAYPPSDLPLAADTGGPKGIETPPTDDEFSQDPDDHRQE